MPSNILSGATDLDAIFAPGDASIDAKFSTGSQNIGNRYAPLSLGAAASATNLFRAASDLNALFAGLGTVAPGGLWPIDSGFVISVAGSDRFVTDTIVAKVGREAWEYYNLGGSVASAAHTSNLMADRFNACPGVANANGSLVAEGSFVNGTAYGLTSGMVLRFEAYTDALGGSSTWDFTVGAATIQRQNWITMHTGGVPLCSNATEYYENSGNVNGFSPGAGLYYGQFTPYLEWYNPNSWIVRLGAMFCIEVGSTSLNLIRVRVKRIT